MIRSLRSVSAQIKAIDLKNVTNVENFMSLTNEKELTELWNMIVGELPPQCEFNLTTKRIVVHRDQTTHMIAAKIGLLSGGDHFNLYYVQRRRNNTVTSLTYKISFPDKQQINRYDFDLHKGYHSHIELSPTVSNAHMLIIGVNDHNSFRRFVIEQSLEFFH